MRVTSISGRSHPPNILKFHSLQVSKYVLSSIPRILSRWLASCWQVLLTHCSTSYTNKNKRCLLLLSCFFPRHQQHCPYGRTRILVSSCYPPPTWNTRSVHSYFIPLKHRPHAFTTSCVLHMNAINYIIIGWIPFRYHRSVSSSPSAAMSQVEITRYKTLDKSIGSDS